MEIPFPEMLVDKANRTCKSPQLKECRLLVLYVFPSIVAGRRRVARLGTSRETLIRMIGINKLCCEFATTLGTARSLHRLSLSTWIRPNDAAVLHAGQQLVGGRMSMHLAP